jgi:hypothetical protein
MSPSVYFGDLDCLIGVSDRFFGDFGRLDDDYDD